MCFLPINLCLNKSLQQINNICEWLDKEWQKIEETFIFSLLMNLLVVLREFVDLSSKGVDLWL